jgi:hypothetical protein
MYIVVVVVSLVAIKFGRISAIPDVSVSMGLSQARLGLRQSMLSIHLPQNYIVLDNLSPFEITITASLDSEDGFIW